MGSPFYGEIPKGLRENLAYRKAVLEYGAESEEHARDVWCMASRDILWCVNALLWTYNPKFAKSGKEPILPFITWDYQDEALLKMQGLFGNEDMIIEKSRDMGASWLCLTLFFHEWLFHKDRSMLMVSRDQDHVEKAGEPDCLFWKIDFHLAHMPPFLVPPHTNTMNEMTNLATGSSLTGAATTGKLARGGRKTAILLDEFAAFEIAEGFQAIGSTQAATDCRIFNSTHQGVNTAFAKLRDTHIARVKMMWWQHPLKKKGLYTTGEKGEFKPLDKDFVYPKKPNGDPCSYVVERTGEPTVYVDLLLDGKMRSPWYDRDTRERLLGDPTLIARELDCDPEASSKQFFQGVASLHKDEYAILPFHKGTLEFDTEGNVVGWNECADGKLHLWIHPDEDGAIPGDDEYVIGSDVSAGAGASNSTHSIWSRRTKEKVGQYVDPHITPERHAQLGVASAHWFHDAFMIWDASGSSGPQFTRAVLDVGYGNIYMRKVPEGRTKRTTDKPGFRFDSTANNAQSVVGPYREDLRSGKIINRSGVALEECGQYVYDRDGRLIHARQRGEQDPSGARSNHGDVVIGDALAALGLRERPYHVESRERKPPRGSIADRMQRAEDEDRTAVAVEEDSL